MKKLLQILMLIAVPAFGQLDEPIHRVTELSKAIAPQPLYLHQEASYDIQWRFTFTNAAFSLAGANQTFFQYAPTNGGWQQTVTGTIFNATGGVVRFRVTPQQTDTNGLFAWQILVSSNGSSILKHPYGLMQIEATLGGGESTNGFPTSGTNIDLAGVTFLNFPWALAGDVTAEAAARAAADTALSNLVIAATGAISAANGTITRVVGAGLATGDASTGAATVTVTAVSVITSVAPSIASAAVAGSNYVNAATNAEAQRATAAYYPLASNPSNFLTAGATNQGWVTRAEATSGVVVAEADPLALLTNGTRAMGGRLNMGANSITNVNTIWPDASGGVLATGDGWPSVDWLARKLYSASGGTMVDWSNPYLNFGGNMTTNQTRAWFTGNDVALRVDTETGSHTAEMSLAAGPDTATTVAPHIRMYGANHAAGGEIEIASSVGALNRIVLAGPAGNIMLVHGSSAVVETVDPLSGASKFWTSNGVVRADLSMSTNYPVYGAGVATVTQTSSGTVVSVSATGGSVATNDPAYLLSITNIVNDNTAAGKVAISGRVATVGTNDVAGAGGGGSGIVNVLSNGTLIASGTNLNFQTDSDLTLTVTERGTTQDVKYARSGIAATIYRKSAQAGFGHGTQTVVQCDGYMDNASGIAQTNAYRIMLVPAGRWRISGQVLWENLDVGKQAYVQLCTNGNVVVTAGFFAGYAADSDFAVVATPLMLTVQGTNTQLTLQGTQFNSDGTPNVYGTAATPYTYLTAEWVGP